jgi:hypothetical protein
MGIKREHSFNFILQVWQLFMGLIRYSWERLSRLLDNFLNLLVIIIFKVFK